MLDPTLAPYHITNMVPLDPDPAPSYPNNLHLRGRQKLSPSKLFDLKLQCLKLREWMRGEYEGELEERGAEGWLWDTREVKKWRPAAMEGMRDDMVELGLREE